jgi:hypothetical protein
MNTIAMNTIALNTIAMNTVPMNTTAIGRHSPIFIDEAQAGRSGAVAREARRQFRMATGIVVLSLIAGIVMAGSQLVGGSLAPVSSGYGIDTAPVMISAPATADARFAQMR